MPSTQKEILGLNSGLGLGVYCLGFRVLGFMVQDRIGWD